ncbi:Nad kinase [Thalictrum thalictroides]|uniref:NAD(+) kinase n=1 Tax=Thalictrum thalictroides TaxID=46969 RepID=A0A7J6UQT7_THATH|nr:Nad kinase [Thalictrum thalictroides]
MGLECCVHMMNLIPSSSGFLKILNGNRDIMMFGFGFSSNRNDRVGVKFVAGVGSGSGTGSGLSSFFSSRIGLDTQTFQSQDISQQSWIGPVPGDIAEIEAYCRIFRSAEQLHTAIMNTLCNPETGECTVSYDEPSEEHEFLEERVVAVLGCLVSLLNKGREAVLTGRSYLMSAFNVADAHILNEKLPPLATFRSEMKRCCESLHIALENYLRPTDGRSTNIWRKLQRLKNVCYDAGFPRGEGFPCPTLFANWNPVYLSTRTEEQTSKDREVAFCSGGQVTDEGLEWLIQEGYKTIVDLRAEAVKDDFCQLALENTISCGKVEVIRLPVEVRTAPSAEQVEIFASLVSNCDKMPIYLHSQEGVWRTSAMVSRWRQYMARTESQFVLNFPAKPNETLSENKRKGGNSQGVTILNDEKNSPINYLSTADATTGVFQNEGSSIAASKNENESGADTSISLQDSTLQGTGGVEIGYRGFCSEVEPLKSQFPACDMFSKREMSRFYKNKNVSPNTFFNYQRNRLKASLITYQTRKSRGQRTQFSYKESRSELVTERNLKGDSSQRDMLSEVASPAANGKYLNGSNKVTFGMDGNGSVADISVGSATKKTSSVGERKLDKKVIYSSVEKSKQGNGKASMASVPGVELIQGDMCASATGVVRVQSRKKAEMFLVRTDGFSCTREKVTESSLAFTHPSTQQQMLMWKSPPKTVLLLKKLGPELMEEAKEVASFLYHQENMNVLVEPDVHDIFARIPGFGFVQTFYTHDTSYLHERVDFVACLGGDGVILHASNLFRGAVPPVVSFNLGSLGFLTSHTFEHYRKDLRQVIHGNNTTDGVYITLRMRLRCEIFRNGKAMPGKVFDVLNEIVVDRGSNPYLSKIECYEHNRLITKVQGDGVIIATPTGSTAYSTAAGGSMVHPNVPCMLFTPICPHSLSFRPVILPDSAQLELKIPGDTRSNAWVSFDGKRRQQLSRGDSVRIYMSQHPLPTVNKSDQTGDWFHSLIRCLNWNERLDQKAL